MCTPKFNWGLYSITSQWVITRTGTLWPSTPSAIQVDVNRCELHIQQQEAVCLKAVNMVPEHLIYKIFQKLILKGKMTKKTGDWKKFLSNDEKKQQLIFVWTSNDFAENLEWRRIIFMAESQTYMLWDRRWHFCKLKTIDELYSNQQETDTRSVLYVCSEVLVFLSESEESRKWYLLSASPLYKTVDKQHTIIHSQCK